MGSHTRDLIGAYFLPGFKLSLSIKHIEKERSLLLKVLFKPRLENGIPECLNNGGRGLRIVHLAKNYMSVLSKEIYYIIGI